MTHDSLDLLQNALDAGDRPALARALETLDAELRELERQLEADLAALPSPLHERLLEQQDQARSCLADYFRLLRTAGLALHEGDSKDWAQCQGELASVQVRLNSALSEIRGALQSPGETG